MDRLNATENASRDAGYRRFLDARKRRVEILREDLQACLPADREIVLEVGCGHGHFLTAYAAAHEDRFCLGIDLVSKRIRKACAKAEKQGLAHLRFFKAEVTEILDAWPVACPIRTLFVLYPDPWPKKRHEKNRILRPLVLDRLAGICEAGACLHFRTDDAGNYEWVREVLTAHPRWRIRSDLPWPFENPTYFQELLGIHESLSASLEA